MLFHRDGFDTGIITNGKFKIHKDKVLNRGKELMHQDKSYDIQEACVQCINKDCQGFIRSEKDGQTEYYRITTQNYEGEDDYMKSPEELDLITYETEMPGSVPISIPGSAILKERAETKPKPKSEPEPETVKQIQRSEMNNLIFYFVLCVLVASITWVLLKRTEPYRSPFVSFKTEREQLYNSVE